MSLVLSWNLPAIDPSLNNLQSEKYSTEILKYI